MCRRKFAFPGLVPALFCTLLALSALGCDTGTSSQSADDLKASQLCTERGQISCDRAFRCLSESQRQSLGLGYASEADCVANLVDENGCAGVTEETICPSNRVFQANMVDWCINDLLALSCGDFFDVTPPACTQVCTQAPVVNDVIDDGGIDGTVDSGLDQPLPDLPPDESMPDLPPDLPPGDDACQSASDQETIAMGDVEDLATECGIGCIAEPLNQQPQCIQDCLTGNTMLSTSCADCYVEDFVCARDNCLPFCIDGNTPDCQLCREDAGCIDEFQRCAGPVP